MFLLNDGHSKVIFKCDLPELQTSGTMKNMCREEIDLLLKNEIYPKLNV